MTASKICRVKGERSMVVSTERVGRETRTERGEREIFKIFVSRIGATFRDEVGWK